MKGDLRAPDDASAMFGSGRPMESLKGYLPVLVWDDYHGFVVGKRDPLDPEKWRLDLPYGFEFGGKEIEVTPRLWWPLPRAPDQRGQPN